MPATLPARYGGCFTAKMKSATYENLQKQRNAPKNTRARRRSVGCAGRARVYQSWHWYPPHRLPRRSNQSPSRSPVQLNVDRSQLIPPKPRRTQVLWPLSQPRVSKSRTHAVSYHRSTFRPRQASACHLSQPVASGCPVRTPHPCPQVVRRRSRAAPVCQCSSGSGRVSVVSLLWRVLNKGAICTSTIVRVDYSRTSHNAYERLRF